MCELDDFEEFSRRTGDVSRRQFGAMALAAGLSAALPRLASATETKGTDVEIKTPDGTCDAYLVHPAKGAYPGVLIWPDIFGLRPAFKEMATRLAESGYSVLVINPFYRTKKAPTAPEHPDLEAVGRRCNHACAAAECSSRSDHHMLTEDHIGFRKAREELVINHRLRAFGCFFRRLENDHHCPAPVIAGIG